MTKGKNAASVLIFVGRGVSIFSISWGEPSEGFCRGKALGSNLPKATPFTEMLRSGGDNKKAFR